MKTYLFTTEEWKANLKLGSRLVEKGLLTEEEVEAIYDVYGFTFETVVALSKKVAENFPELAADEEAFGKEVYVTLEEAKLLLSDTIEDEDDYYFDDDEEDDYYFDDEE